MQLATSVGGNGNPYPFRYRRTERTTVVTFPRKADAHFRPIDRNARARILHMVEAHERATKLPGKRCGRFGLTGLAVLKALLCTFANGRTGACFPSYDAIQKHTGLARATIAKALAALEHAGIIEITRTMVFVMRNGVQRMRRGVNCYRFSAALTPFCGPLLKRKGARPFNFFARVHSAHDNHQQNFYSSSLTQQASRIVGSAKGVVALSRDQTRPFPVPSASLLASPLVAGWRGD